jgi:hypothetical protein
VSVVTALALAHGIGGLKDLPVPGWLFLYGAAVALVLSFVALGALWRRPHLESAGDGRPLPPGLQSILLSRALRGALGVGSAVLLLLIATAALLGEPSPARNLAPTFVFVVFWLGVVPLVVLLGNVWSVLNPWNAVAEGLGALWRRTGRNFEPLAPYPERLGRWPAAVLLFAFAAFELAYDDPSSPRALALAIYVYSAITWYGMIWFGRRTWLANGDAFAVYFALLARIAPFATRERDKRREIVLRPPLTGLAVRDEQPGTLAFVAVMLGSVAFDGLSRTSWWQERRTSVAAAEPDLFYVAGIAVNIAGLLAAVGLVALAYLAAVEAGRRLSQSRRDLSGAFVMSLVPIALVYVVAHYFTLLLIQGQFAIPLASDPFGRGWDVLGTSDFQPNLAPLSPNTVWYVQVGALVVGHVLGLVLAHDRAVALFRSAEIAVRTQFAILGLMVLYTVSGLWLLSQG